MRDSFDQYSIKYNELVDNAVSPTGYSTNSLVIAKLQKLKNLFPTLSGKPFRLLDFGCGIGNLYSSIGHIFPQVTYTGVDPSKDSILQARSRFNDEILFHESTTLEWQALKFDLIFASGVFHHIPHIEHTRIIQQLCSLLNRDGNLVIWEHNPGNPVTRKIVNDCIFDQDAILVSPTTLKSQLREASLTNVKVIYTTFFPKYFSILNCLDPYLSWLPVGGQYLVTGRKT